MTKYTPTTGQVRVAYQDHQDFQAVVKGLDRPGDVEAGIPESYRLALTGGKTTSTGRRWWP